IDLGHGRGMAVIPWFEFGFMAPADYSLYRRHPDWFTQRQASPLAGRSAGLARLARQKQGGDSPLTDPGIWMEGNVIPRRWLNPFHPQVQKFLLELIDDLVSHYAVDGCQFDDHLGLPIDFGYDPYTVNLYRMEHNGQAPPANPKDPEWVAWRARKISDFLILVNKLVKARRPQAVLSISPNPYPWSYQNYLQDWPTWVNLGLVDELVVQVYRSDQNRFIWEMTNPSLQAALARVPTSIGLLSGLQANPVRVEHLRDQIYALRDRRLAGMSFFFYESLWLPPSRESRAQRLATLEQVLSPPLPRPR
ncbi:MAG: glycoside hydrolase family 10 protein, partial [Nodosilinea sp.]